MGGRRIPFQCRVLKHPDLPTPEITLWTACIDGRWDDIRYEPPPVEIDGTYSVSGSLLTLLVSYKARWIFFCERIRLILFISDPTASKQFVRFSIPLTTEWQPALAELEAFAHQWLEPQ
jgi:hypothetical protein